MDVSTAIVAKSDQVNAIDLVSGPQTVTVVEVTEGTAEQRVNIVTDIFGPGRPFKPSKTVLRILVNAWGKETNDWIGHAMTIYRDPAVRWAGEEVGGIRVSALSHVDKAFTMSLPTSKGKNSKATITPLETRKDTSGRDWLTELAVAAQIDKAAVLSLYRAAQAAHADPGVIELITKTGKELGEAEKSAGVEER